jgi:hypothetical protein
MLIILWALGGICAIAWWLQTWGDAGDKLFWEKFDIRH